MFKTRLLSAVLCLASINVVLGACSAPPAVPQPVSTPMQTVMNSPLSSPVARELSGVSNPVAGKATVTGGILSEAAGKPLARISIHLAEVYRQNGEAAYILNTASSPSTLTNDAGQFIAKDIPAREYVIVIGEPNSSYAILNEPSGQAKVWDAAVDRILDVGTQKVTLQ